jgi:inner membrane protein
MNQEKSNVEKASQWFRNSITVRLLGMGVILLLLLIPMSMVESLIYERIHHHSTVKYEIADSWGKSQVIGGPILTVPYETTYEFLDPITKEPKVNRQRFTSHFLAEDLQITGEMIPEIRHRGIYNVTVYESHLNLEGKFHFPQDKRWPVENVEILWNEAILSVEIPDLRGVQENIIIDFSGEEIPMNAGLAPGSPLMGGVSCPIELDPENAKELDFNFNIKLRGSDGLSFHPWAKNTEVNIQSDWTAPSYFGAFPPDEINEDTSNGFKAGWQVLHLNRNIPQTFQSIPNDLYQYSFGVRLNEETNDYKSTERAAKYAVLFIALTFLTFFIIQISKGIKLHPVQFMLVGLSLCVFYILLLSLGEHIGFKWAYTIAGLSIIALIGTYMKAAFNSNKLAWLVVSVMGLLYFFIYVIIQLVDFALLVGSIGLFIALATLMFASRRMDWYQLKQSSLETEGLKN